jgi:hypothetical protein
MNAAYKQFYGTAMNLQGLPVVDHVHTPQWCLPHGCHHALNTAYESAEARTACSSSYTRTSMLFFYPQKWLPLLQRCL